MSELAAVQQQPAANGAESKTALQAPAPPEAGVFGWGRQAELSPRGIVLRNVEDILRWAKIVVDSGLAPKNMETIPAVALATEMGLELGLSPMQALQNIAVINGRPSLWGDAMLAIAMNSPLFDQAAFREEWSGAGEDLSCTCTVRRLPHGQPIARSFSRGDALTAGLTKKGGPHTEYPRRMLQMRARSWALRDAFPDLLRGMLTVEEARDIIDVDSNPVPAETAPRPAGRSLDRLTEELTAVPAAIAAAQPPAPSPAAAPEPTPAQAPTAASGPSPTQSALETPAAAQGPLEGLAEALAAADTVTDVGRVEGMYLPRGHGLENSEVERVRTACEARRHAIREGRGGGKGRQQSLV